MQVDSNALFAFNGAVRGFVVSSGVVLIYSLQ